MLFIRFFIIHSFSPFFSCFFFFFNDTATTEIYTLSLHDALPISPSGHRARLRCSLRHSTFTGADRKSTRLNSSHTVISYAVFCLKKKKQIKQMTSKIKEEDDLVHKQTQNQRY